MSRVKIRTYAGRELCQVDVAKHAEPVWANTRKEQHVFFARFNNSTRAVPEDEVNAYVVAHWQS